MTVFVYTLIPKLDVINPPTQPYLKDTLEIFLRNVKNRAFRLAATLHFSDVKWPTSKNPISLCFYPIIFFVS